MNEEPHEVEAYYAAVGGRVYRVLACSCGARSMSDSWEAAGAAFDQHLPPDPA